MFQSPPTSVYNHISSIYHPYIIHISSINGKIIIYHISQHYHNHQVIYIYIYIHIIHILAIYHPYTTSYSISSHPNFHHPRRLSMQVALLLRRLGSHLLPLHLDVRPSRATGCCTQAANSRESVTFYSETIGYIYIYAYI